jgi:thymidylate synthase ThyX
MDFNVKVVLDSVAPNKARLTTLEVTMPRILLAQLNTHRQFSRNSASSRAVPTPKMLERINQHPFVPEEWGTNQRGMQAGPALSGDSAEAARDTWLACRDAVIRSVQRLHELGVHKQLANRLLEPFMWVTVIVSSTEWANFFNLRCHEDAQPELQKVARMMSDALAGSTPRSVGIGEWHLPYILDDERAELSLEMQRQCSVARCARVSYLTHEGKRDVGKDQELYERLLRGSSFGHWSPFEHVATPRATEARDISEGNYTGWIQYRKMFADECQTVWPRPEDTATNIGVPMDGAREPSVAR